MYKLIACDLDETLLDSEHQLSEANRAAIAAARERGVKFVPATGRGFNTVAPTLSELGLFDKEDEYIISFNGGVISENRNDRLLCFDGISFELASELYRRGLDYDVCIHVYTVDKVYVYNYTDGEQAYLAGRMPMYEIYGDNIDFLHDEPVVKALYMNTDRAYLQAIERELIGFGDRLDFSYSSNRYLEFNRKGVSKGSGLAALAQKLGVPIEQTIAIGDNLNDLSMIKTAGLGVSVANASAALKAQSDYVTVADNDHNAVAEVIERFILGNRG